MNMREKLIALKKGHEEKAEADRREAAENKRLRGLFIQRLHALVEEFNEMPMELTKSSDGTYPEAGKSSMYARKHIYANLGKGLRFYLTVAPKPGEADKLEVLLAMNAVAAFPREYWELNTPRHARYCTEVNPYETSEELMELEETQDCCRKCQPIGYQTVLLLLEPDCLTPFSVENLNVAFDLQVLGSPLILPYLAL
jgi:hypothetical protein